MQQIFIIASSCLFIFIINFFNLHTIFTNGEILPFQQFLGDVVAINCGCLSNSTALDGRHWVGDGEIQPKGNSMTAISAGNFLMGDPTPFFTARVSSTCFSYTFKVNAGQKFVRLHFYPAPYLGFRNSLDFFTVKANSFLLLRNFSASIAADELNVKYFVKEFCLSVNETGILQIEFSALYSNSFVFVNGIEIISMPNGLYYTPFDNNQGAIMVGHHNHFYYVDNSTALELIQRLNVGGGSVLPVEDDTGMFRKWSDDADYVTASSGFEQIRNAVPAITSPFLAPFKIYQTSRILKKGLQVKEKHHFTWKIPVDLGFCYLVRLHLCSWGGGIAEIEDLSIVIQNVVVEMIRLSAGNGIAEYRDYLVMMKGDRTEGKRDLFVSLRSFDELVLGIMKGLEIFKLSNPDNSLASPNLNPFSPIRDYSFWSVKIQNILVGFGRLNMIMTAFTTLLVIVNVVAYQLTQISKHKFWQDKDKHVRLVAPNEPSCHRFTLTEILSATRNFDDALVIGKGGFGKVYKGLVSGHSEVLAIKRLKAESRQGAHEFWREIETLSKLRHIHLVPLLGYCNEGYEMILVYEYMPRGTVADNIYKARINGDNNGIPLTWEQRLRICIGAARGLDYLHRGTQYGIIHRDVKDTNILLDENYVAKISDFGLSKQGSILTKTQDQLSTRVKGTIGYLDPHYIATHKPSIASDVYAFGVVLLVALSGRPALEIKFPGEISSLLTCFRECMEKGEMNEIIDPSIHGEMISTESLTKFMEAVENCVHHLPKKRATMAQLVVNLESALEKNRALDPSTQNDDEIVVHQPLPVEPSQPFEFFELQVAPIPEENGASFPVEGNTNKEIQKLPTKVEVLQSRVTDHNTTKKPSWGRPWFGFKNILKKDVKIFLMKDIKLATRNFSDEFKIGKGRHYKLYKAEFITGGGSRILEIKRMKPSTLDSWGGVQEAFQAQIEFLRLDKPHINLVPIVGYCNEDHECPILVYEYTPHVNTLDEYIFRKCTSNVLSWEQRLIICRDAARGLHHLHKYRIIHKDVKVSNIALDENLVPKISGFGCSDERRFGRIRDTFSLMRPTQFHVGTPGYLDPYYGVTGTLNEASDVYSFGIVMLVVLSGTPPVNLIKEHDLVPRFTECFTNGNFKEILDPYLKWTNPFKGLEIFVELIDKCLILVPKSRPDMAQVVADLDAALRLALY